MAFARKVGVPSEATGVPEPCRGVGGGEDTPHGSSRAAEKFPKNPGEKQSSGTMYQEGDYETW